MKKNRDYPLSPTPPINPSVYKGVDKERRSKVQGYVEASGGNKSASGAAGVNYNINKNLSVNANAFGGKDEFGKFAQYEVGATVKLPIGRKRKR